MMPNTGGDIEYLKRAYGKSASFSFSWFLFWISKPGSQAIISTVFGNYLVTVFTGLDNADKNSTNSKIAAVALIIISTIVNCFGVQTSSAITNTLTITKLTLVVLVVLSGATYLARNQSALR